MEEEIKQKEQTEQKDNITVKIKELVEKELKRLSESGIQVNNIDYYGKLVDIHKDIENEDYWKEKKEVYKMRYSEYGGDYSDGGQMEYGAYGRRGVPGSGRGRRYRGYSGPEEKMEEMREHYGAYSEGRDRGSYGAKQDSIKGLENMMTCITECVEMVFEDASPEEKQIIQKYIRRMGEM